jgi:nucleotide-binding universal stress UspA family protein
MSQDPEPRAARIIVAGVDPSVHSHAVVDWAAAQARDTGAQLRVVFGWTTPPVPGEGRPSVEFDLYRAADKTVEDLVADLPDDLDVETVAAHEQPVPLLLRQARHADLLVLGSRGAGHPAGAGLGSVTLGCLEQAACPTVVIPVGVT